MDDYEERFSITNHLQELRKRLLRVIVAVGITTAISFFLVKYIIALLESRAEGINLIYVEMTEMIGTYCKVAVFSGIALAMPFILYEAVMFTRPALTGTERKRLYAFLPITLLAFAAGVSFGYFVLVPPAARFLITFGSDIATPEIRVSNFISTMVRLLFGIGLCFETPIVIFLLSRIGLVTPQSLSKYRKFVIVGAFALGAIITPTFDPLNQSLVAVPLICLYELGIVLARIGGRKSRKSEINTS